MLKVQHNTPVQIYYEKERQPFNAQTETEKDKKAMVMIMYVCYTPVDGKILLKYLNLVV